MKNLIFSMALMVTVPAFAQDSGYRDYDQGSSERMKMPVNVGHQVGSALNKARRTMNESLGALGNASLDGSQQTVMNGRDVFNVGGLVVNSDAPINAGNIIIVSRPNGAGGLEGPSERQLPRRR